MAAFSGMQITNQGRALQAKAQTGVELRFTRIALGDGQLTGQEISELKDLIHLKKSLEIMKLQVRPGGTAVVGGYLSNQDMVTGFYFRELGIFAQDPDVGEILYAYDNAGSTAEYIPAGSGSSIVEKYIDLNILIKNAANVSAVIDQSLIFATQKDLNDQLGDLKTVPTAAKNVAGALTELFTNVSDGKEAVAAAITDKGVDASGSDTFPQLADKIGQITTGVETGDATATAAEILAGKTAYAQNIKITGTMPNRGAVTLTPGAADVSIPSGYHNGAGIIKGAPDLISPNIRAGKSIFGIGGKAEVVDTADANAAASQILSGRTAYVAGTKVTGTMPNQSAPVQATGTAQWPDGQLAVYAPAGYYNGAKGGGSEVRVSQSQLQAAEPELIASNLLAGVNLFGILGTAPKVRIARGSFSAGTTSDTPVNGLGFQPELIIFSFQGWTGAWAAKELFQNPAAIVDVNAWKQSSQAYTAISSVNSDGFVWSDVNGKDEANVVFVAFRFS